MKLILTRARFVVLSRPKSMRIATQRKYEGGDPLNPIKILTEHLKILSLKTVDQRYCSNTEKPDFQALKS